jgi:hypothetical protein
MHKRLQPTKYCCNRRFALAVLGCVCIFLTGTFQKTTANPEQNNDLILARCNPQKDGWVGTK